MHKNNAKAFKFLVAGFFQWKFWIIYKKMEFFYGQILEQKKNIFIDKITIRKFFQKIVDYLN